MEIIKTWETYGGLEDRSTCSVKHNGERWSISVYPRTGASPHGYTKINYECIYYKATGRNPIKFLEEELGDSIEWAQVVALKSVAIIISKEEVI